MFFFLQHKAAYEIRISDWSSDVCSSDLNPHGGARIGSEKRLDTPERFSGEAAVQNASLIDFAGPSRATPVALAHRLSVGTVALTRCTLHPNPGRRIGAVQLTVAVHQGAPFRMEWRMPGRDRLQQRHITPGPVPITSRSEGRRVGNEVVRT